MTTSTIVKVLEALPEVQSVLADRPSPPNIHRNLSTGEPVSTNSFVIPSFPKVIVVFTLCIVEPP